MRVFLRSCCSCSLVLYVAVKSWRSPPLELQVEVLEVHLSPLRANPPARRARRRTRKKTKKVLWSLSKAQLSLELIIIKKKNSSMALFSMFLLYFLQEMELAVRKISYVQLWSVSSIDLQIRRRLFNSCVASCSSPTLPLCAGKPTASHCISTGT